MRQTATPINGRREAGGYTFSFQIANDGARRSCRVRIDAPSMRDASVLFRENWPTIEAMARGRIQRGTIGDDGVITIIEPS
jgi:hypothetical protein